MDAQELQERLLDYHYRRGQLCLTVHHCGQQIASFPLKNGPPETMSCPHCGQTVGRGDLSYDFHYEPKAGEAS